MTLNFSPLGFVTRMLVRGATPAALPPGSTGAAVESPVPAPEPVPDVDMSGPSEPAPARRIRFRGDSLPHQGAQERARRVRLLAIGAAQRGGIRCTSAACEAARARRARLS